MIFHKTLVPLLTWWYNIIDIFYYLMTFIITQCGKISSLDMTWVWIECVSVKGVRVPNFKRIINMYFFHMSLLLQVSQSNTKVNSTMKKMHPCTLGEIFVWLPSLVGKALLCDLWNYLDVSEGRTIHMHKVLCESRYGSFMVYQLCPLWNHLKRAGAVAQQANPPLSRASIPMGISWCPSWLLQFISHFLLMAWQSCRGASSPWDSTQVGDLEEAFDCCFGLA